MGELVLAGQAIAGTTRPAATGATLIANSAANGQPVWVDSNGSSHSLGGLTGYYDVTTYGLLGDDSTDNLAAINTMLSTIPVGSTVYFPPGAYRFSGAINPGARRFYFQGAGAIDTVLKTTSATADLFTLTDGNWYTTWADLGFTTTVNKTAGAMISTGTVSGSGNVGTHVRRCNFSAAGSGINLFNGINFAGSQAANSTFVDDCTFTNFSNYGITLQGNTSSNQTLASLVLTNTIMQGQLTSGNAAACMQVTQAGAVQIDNCDFIGAVNNLLINPATGAPVQGVFSLYCTNTYFDNSAGSCLKLSSSGNIERCKFIGCSFTTGTFTTGLSAVEITSTAAILPTAIDFIDCSFLNTFGTTGTTNGLLANGCQDVTLIGCRIAGWTNGVQITPSAGSVTKPFIEGCIIGATGNIGANTVGILLNAGTYGSQTILDNNLMNNTTAITDSSTVTTTANNNRTIKNNQGFNPKSVVAQPAVAATGVAVFNSTGVDCMVVVKGGTFTVLAVGGVTTGITAATTGLPVLVAANQQIAITFSVAPTWVWIGM